MRGWTATALERELSKIKAERRAAARLGDICTVITCDGAIARLSDFLDGTDA